MRNQSGLVPQQMVVVGHDGQGNPIYAPPQQAQIQSIQPPPGYAPMTSQLQYHQSPGVLHFSSVTISPGSVHTSYPASYPEPAPIAPAPMHHDEPPAPAAPASLSSVRFSIQQLGWLLAFVGAGILFLSTLGQLAQREAQIEGIRQGAELVRP